MVVATAVAATAATAAAAAVAAAAVAVVVDAVVAATEGEAAAERRARLVAVRLVAGQGGDVNIREEDDEGWTPMTNAAFRGDLSVVRALAAVARRARRAGSR